jgi:hypothetical protein
MLKQRDLNASHKLVCAGRNNSEPSSGFSCHAGGTRPGQTRKKPKDLSVREREERGCGEDGGLYAEYMRERGGGAKRVRAHNFYLCCHTHLDTSVSRTWADSASGGCDNRCTCVHV